MNESFEKERKNVGPGWQKLVEFTHHYLNLIDPGYKVLQIKEKFGGLRYYVELSQELDEQDVAICNNLVSLAEEISFRICEDCGGKGNVQSMDGWLKTFCVQDAEKAKARREQKRQESAGITAKSADDARRKAASK